MRVLMFEKAVKNLIALIYESSFTQIILQFSPVFIVVFYIIYIVICIIYIIYILYYLYYVLYYHNYIILCIIWKESLKEFKMFSCGDTNLEV